MKKFEEILEYIEKTPVEQIELEEIRFAFKTVNVVQKPKNVEDIQKVLDAIMAKNPSAEKINELNLPLLAVYVQDVDRVREFANNGEVNLLQESWGKNNELQGRGMNLRGASPIYLAYSDLGFGGKFQEIAEIITKAELAKAGGAKIPAGLWISSGSVGDLRKALEAARRYEKFKNNFEVTNKDIESYLKVAVSYRVVELFEDQRREMSPGDMAKLDAFILRMAFKCEQDIMTFLSLDEEMISEKDFLGKLKAVQKAKNLGVGVDDEHMQKMAEAMLADSRLRNKFAKMAQEHDHLKAFEPILQAKMDEVRASRGFFKNLWVAFCSYTFSSGSEKVETHLTAEGGIPGQKDDATKSQEPAKGHDRSQDMVQSVREELEASCKANGVEMSGDIKARLDGLSKVGAAELPEKINELIFDHNRDVINKWYEGQSKQLESAKFAPGVDRDKISEAEQIILDKKDKMLEEQNDTQEKGLRAVAIKEKITPSNVVGQIIENTVPKQNQGHQR